MPRGKIRWRDVFKWTGVLHMDVGRMSLWEFRCATDGYAEANGAKPKGRSIDDDRMADLGIEGF